MHIHSIISLAAANMATLIFRSLIPLMQICIFVNGYNYCLDVDDCLKFETTPSCITIEQAVEKVSDCIEGSVPVVACAAEQAHAHAVRCLTLDVSVKLICCLLIVMPS